MSFNIYPRKRVSIDFSNEKTLTEQCHKDTCDIHNIMRKYRQTGILEHVKQYGGKYGDFTSAVGFHEAMTIIAEAEQMFETVPADIRKKFGNDPAEYLAFMQDPNNRDKILDMGLDASHLPEPASEPAPEPIPDPAPDLST